MTKRKTKNTAPFRGEEKITLNSLELTTKQKKILQTSLSEDSKIMFVSGPAGSSKTYISVYSALRLLAQNNDLELLYVRTIIESAEKGLGALPGDLNEKFNPYMLPLEDKLYEILPKNTTLKHSLFDKGRIEAMPINFLRGASWKNKIVIMDEAQNATFKELTTLITRLGENSKLFICGDYMQSDINGKSGFVDMMNLFDDEKSKEKGIHCIKFNQRDIKRSEILKYIISKLETKNNEAGRSN